MPNWCMNQFTVKHEDEEMLNMFVEAVNNGNLFQTFIPMPEEYKEGDRWYGWSVSNWGTKWDISNGAIAEFVDKNTAKGFFDTAWSPPIEAFNKLTDMGFELDVLYDEEGMAFIGVFNSVYGEQTYEYNFEDPEWRVGIDNDAVLEILEERYDMWLEQQEDQQDYFDSLEDEQEEEQSNG